MLSLAQPCREVGVAVLLRPLRWGEAVLVNRRGAGFGLKQQVDNLSFALGLGIVQGRRTVVVHRGDACPSLQKLGCYIFLAFSGGPV